MTLEWLDRFDWLDDPDRIELKEFARRCYALARLRDPANFDLLQAKAQAYLERVVVPNADLYCIHGPIVDYPLRLKLIRLAWLCSAPDEQLDTPAAGYSDFRLPQAIAALRAGESVRAVFEIFWITHKWMCLPE